MSRKGQTSGPRRSTHQSTPVEYAAVGASAAPDLLRFPPANSTPYEETLQIGSGQERFVLASSLLMTWGAHRGSGLAVREVERGEGEYYDGVSFDSRGVPQPTPNAEALYSPEGEPYLTAGTTVEFTDGQIAREALVIYTVAEDRCSGFGWGDRQAAHAYGEHRMTVELRRDDSVWATVRGFVFTAHNGLFGMKGKHDTRDVLDLARRLLRALAPGAVSHGATGTAAGSAEPLAGSVHSEHAMPTPLTDDESIEDAEIVTTSEVVIVESVIDADEEGDLTEPEAS